VKVRKRRRTARVETATGLENSKSSHRSDGPRSAMMGRSRRSTRLRAANATARHWKLKFLVEKKAQHNIFIYLFMVFGFGF
jgi:hypothetical protein